MPSLVEKHDGPLRPILTLLTSNMLGTAVGGAFFIIASQKFDLQEMGLYAVAISVQWILAGLLGTGLSIAAIRLASDHLGHGERGAAAGVVAAAVGTAGVISLMTAGLCYGLAALFPEAAFLPARLLGLAALWAGSRSVLDCLRSGLLAQKNFTRAAVLMVVSGVTGLTALGLMLVSGPFTLSRLLTAHAAGLSSAAAVGIVLLQPLWRSGLTLPAGRYRAFLRYSGWPALSEGTRLLQANLGPLVLVALAGSAEAGLFGLGRYPAMFFEVIAISLYQYWLPTAVQQQGTDGLVRFLGSQMRLAALVGFGMVVLAVIGRPVIPLLGENFAAAAHLFVLNTLDFALFVLIRPIETTFHGLYKPWLELLPRLARLVLLLGVAFVLAPRFGAIGMVWAQVFSGLAGLLIAFGLLWRTLDPASRRQIARSFVR